MDITYYHMYVYHMDITDYHMDITLISQIIIWISQVILHECTQHQINGILV